MPQTLPPWVPTACLALVGIGAMLAVLWLSLT